MYLKMRVMKVNYESYNLTLAGKAQKASIKEELLLIFGIHRGIWIGVCQKTRKKKQKNCGHKHGPFASDDQIQKFFLKGP